MGGMGKTLSLDLRERILAAYDADEGTRETVPRRFRVSLGLVKKLLQQRRRPGLTGLHAKAWVFGAQPLPQPRGVLRVSRQHRALAGQSQLG